MKKTGDPTTLAPEICVEGMSGANDWDEMMEKRALYREAGAEEVWVVAEEGEVHFFTEEASSASDLLPGFPSRL